MEEAAAIAHPRTRYKVDFEALAVLMVDELNWVFLVPVSGQIIGSWSLFLVDQQLTNH